jgi:predicted DNA binding protein
MWILKMKFWHEGSTVIPLAQKYNVTVLAFPLNRYEKDGDVFITSGHILQGREKDKKAYIEEIVKNPRYEHLEYEGTFVVYTTRAKKGATHLQMYLSPELIFVKPIIIKPDGFEYLEVAALNKKVLMDFLEIAQKRVKIELQKISQEPIRDLYVPHIMPDMTGQQRKAIMLAYSNGFYDFPKKTNIQNLAKLMKCSPSTFQEHLRKAEEKLVPFVLESISQK